MTNQIAPNYQTKPQMYSPAGVLINIFDPTGNACSTQGSTQGNPQGNPEQTDQTYNVPTNSQWGMPQSSVYGENGGNANTMRPFIPGVQYKKPVAEQTPAAPAVPPVSKIETAQQTENNQRVQNTANAAAPAQTTTAAAQSQADPNAESGKILTALTSQNIDEQSKALKTISDLSNADAANPQNQALFKSLVGTESTIPTLLGVMSKDISTLPGPNAEQVKQQEQLKANNTEWKDWPETAKSEQDKAYMNKLNATYALGIIQKELLKDINNIATKQNEPKLSLTDTVEDEKGNKSIFPGLNEVMNNIANDPDAGVRKANLQTLSYVATPKEGEPDYLSTQDKNTLRTTFITAAQDKDPSVREDAITALGNLGKISYATGKSEIEQTLTGISQNDADQNIKTLAQQKLTELQQIQAQPDPVDAAQQTVPEGQQQVDATAQQTTSEEQVPADAAQQTAPEGQQQVDAAAQQTTSEEQVPADAAQQTAPEGQQQVDTTAQQPASEEQPEEQKAS